jgi:uncharacterized membrane protein
MNRYGPYFAILLSIFAISAIIPAYAEVTSLKTDSSFYKGGDKIYFSGTILDTDPSTVTVLIFNPSGGYLVASGIADSTSHQFQIMVDTSVQSNQQQLSVKGMYNATAFIANKTEGKTVSFAFSPDGSPITPSAPTSLTATVSSSTEVDLSWVAPQNNGGLPITGYQIERNDGNGFNVIGNSQTTTYQDTGLIPSSEHAYMVAAVNSAGAGALSNSAPVTMLSAPTQSMPPTQNTTPPTDQNSNQSLSDILQQRYADARKLQELLNAQNSGSSNTNPSSTSQNAPKTIQLNENILMTDSSVNQTSQKSTGGQKNNLPSIGSNFDAKTMLYPVITLVGVGIVVAILYLRKKQKISSSTIETKTSTMPVAPAPEPQEDDHAMMILKNRLAKGEITVDEFKALKEELSEP